MFIGVSQFEDPRFAPVPFAVDDAVDLAFVFSVNLGLIRPEKCVLALAGEPHKPESTERLQHLLAAGAQQRPATFTDIYSLLSCQHTVGQTRGLFVAVVATHCLSDQGNDFLIAADSLWERVAKTGVAVDELFSEVARAKALQRLVFLDAFRRRALSLRLSDAIGNAARQVVLASARLGGLAYDDHERKNSVFTAAVVDGLLGKAPADSEGFITIRTLADYIDQHVLEWVKAHGSEHAQRNAGICRHIDRHIEKYAGALPLAVIQAGRKTSESYRWRREAAIERLRENIGEVITGTLYEQIKGRLPLAGAGQKVEELLKEIEALDGSVRSQRSLAYYAREAGCKKPRHNRWLWGTAVTAVAVFALFFLLSGRRAPYAEPTTAAKEPPPSVGSAPPAVGAALDGPSGMRFRYVPPGPYQIWSVWLDETDRDADETLHQVELTRGFWIGETEVTQEQWREFTNTNPAGFLNCGDECPVENVNWYEAVTFTNRLSDREGLESCYQLSGCTGTLGGRRRADYYCKEVTFKGLDCSGYRLPTEAEWEVAARAGQQGASYKVTGTRRGEADAFRLDKNAWYSDNSSRPRPVKMKEPNEWQLYDMLGNVWEWTWDRYGPYSATSMVDPLGPESGSNRVIRGGSWINDARNVSAAVRYSYGPDIRYDFIGFRLARGQLLQE